MSVWFDDAWTDGPPDWRRLYAKAEGQGGYFNNDDARTEGGDRGGPGGRQGHTGWTDGASPAVSGRYA